MKPILFNAQMVRAILDGRKTQTRRVVKPQPPVDAVPYYDRVLYWKTPQRGEGVPYAKPTYAPGDILWVRETWRWKTPSVLEETKYIYRADIHPADETKQKWRPSIHMPKEAARIFLRVTDARVERLWDISSEDVYAEGTDSRLWAATRDAFRRIWDSTIKPSDINRYGWDANPWVWVISFERYYLADPEGGASDG